MRRWVVCACVAVAASGCFDPPKPNCTFACDLAAPSCPDGYTCTAEGSGPARCHLILAGGSPAPCNEPDGAPDATISDAPVDGAFDAAPDAATDAAIDASPVDASPIDASPPDASPPDASPIDASLPDAA